MSFNAIFLIITVGIIVIDSQRLANSTSCSLVTGGICDSAILRQTAATPLATCHLTCHKKHCRTICTTSSSTFAVDDVKNRRRMIKSKLVRRKQRLYDTEHEPFDAKDNPFSSPNDATVAPIFEVTPLTISEAELEEELRRMSTLPYPIKQHDEQYDDERNEEPPSDSTDTTPFTTIAGERFTIPPTTESDPPTTTFSTTTSATLIFPTLLPQPPFEPPTRSVTPRRTTTPPPPPTLPLPPAPPNILPPSTMRARNISPPGFSPKPPGFEPENEDDDENEDNTEEFPDVKLKKITPPKCVEPSSDRLRVKSSRKKKKKLVVTFSTEDFDDLEEEDDDNDPPEKNKKKILKPPTRRPTIRRPKISIVRSRKKCPPPEICEPNCGIFLDEDGCQGCQCLWIAGPCDSDLDCQGEGQFCDFGLCNCARGFEYDEQNSGVCRRVSGRPDRVDNVRRVGSVQNGVPIVPPLNRLVSGRSGKRLPEERAHLRKVLGLGPFQTHRRSRRDVTPSTVRNRKRIRVRTTTTRPSTTTSTVTIIPSTTVVTSRTSTTTTMAPVIVMPDKPMREERLQWPGPCTIDGDCPPGLYCIASDCWAIPEKPIRADGIDERRLPGAVTPNISATSVQRVIWTTTTAPPTAAITIPPLNVITDTNMPSFPVAPVPGVPTAPRSDSSITSTALIGKSEAQPPGWTPPVVSTRAPAEIVADAEAQVAAAAAKVASTVPPSTSAKPSHDVREVTQPKHEPMTTTTIPTIIHELLVTTPSNDDFLINFNLPPDKNDIITNNDNEKHFDVAKNEPQSPVGTKINENSDGTDTIRRPEIHLKTPSASDDLQSSGNEGTTVAPGNLHELWSTISDASLWTGDQPDAGLPSNQLNRRLHHSKIFSDYDYDNIRNAENIFMQSTVAPNADAFGSTISSNLDIEKLDYQTKTTTTATVNHQKNFGSRNGRNQTNRVHKDARRIENSRVDDGHDSHVDHMDRVDKNRVDHSGHDEILGTESTGFIAKSGPIITKYKVNRPPGKSDRGHKTHPISRRTDTSEVRATGNRIIDDYSARNRMRRPVRVQIHDAKSIIRDECATDTDCGGVGAPADARRIDEPRAKQSIYGRGVRLLCCTKRWCDLSADCGTARFCLPDCRFTKLTHLAWARPAPHGAVKDDRSGAPLLDLIYD